MDTAYSRRVLEDAPERVLTFLAAIGTSAPVRAALAHVGYSAKDHEEGWRLLHAATGYQEPIVPPAAEAPQGAAAAAIAELDAWDEPHFRLARAALLRRHPGQAAFLFADLEPASGPAAVLSVRTLLDRLDALEGTAPGRNHKDKAEKAGDQAALALLAQRGITAAERQRLRDLIKRAEAWQALSAQATATAAEREHQAAARWQALSALRAWYDEWAETARVVIRRRDQLIRLGLARRRSGASADAADDGPDAGDAPPGPESPAAGG